LITSCRSETVNESMTKSRSATMNDTPVKSQNKPCKNHRNDIKGRRCGDLVRETGLDKDYIHIFILYFWMCPFVHSLLCHSSVEILAPYINYRIDHINHLKSRNLQQCRSQTGNRSKLSSYSL
jgi:hypothetical protein